MTFGLSGCVPVIHHIITDGYHEAVNFAALGTLIPMAFLYLSGAVIYATRFPESIWPGKFNIWVGHLYCCCWTYLYLGQFNLQFVLLIDISYCHHHCMIVVTSTQDTTETNILSYLIVVCRYILWQNVFVRVPCLSDIDHKVVRYQEHCDQVGETVWLTSAIASISDPCPSHHAS